MLIIVDTSVLVALLNPSDQNHFQAVTRLKAFSPHETLKIPQIAKIEFIGHLTRWKTVKDNRIRKLREYDRLGWSVAEHVASDYLEAENWWKQFADWPIDYPDALILATAVRSQADAVWLFDGPFTRLILQVARKIQPIGFGVGK